MDDLRELGSKELDLRLFQQAAQCLIRLEDAAVGRYQDHADRGMRERAVKPVLAVVQLGEVPRRVSGFALGRSDLIALRALGCLDLLEVEMERRQKHPDDWRRGDQDSSAKPVESNKQKAGDRSTRRVHQAKPTVTPKQLQG